MTTPKDLTRRSFLTAQVPSVHISSAVVSVLPAHRENVVRLLSSMDSVEVHHQSPSKIVIVLEGPESGVLGARLAEIASIDGVLSANMVFEQIERLADLGEQP
jgi:periplasmic nitrate reductase NapD